MRRAVALYGLRREEHRFARFFTPQIEKRAPQQALAAGRLRTS
jgi:hypothetical protein